MATTSIVDKDGNIIAASDAAIVLPSLSTIFVVAI